MKHRDLVHLFHPWNTGTWSGCFRSAARLRPWNTGTWSICFIR